jgi:hypothetical protein
MVCFDTVDNRPGPELPCFGNGDCCISSPVDQGISRPGYEPDPVLFPTPELSLVITLIKRSAVALAVVVAAAGLVSSPVMATTHHHAKHHVSVHKASAHKSHKKTATTTAS